LPASRQPYLISVLCHTCKWDTLCKQCCFLSHINSLPFKTSSHILRAVLNSTLLDGIRRAIFEYDHNICTLTSVPTRTRNQLSEHVTEFVTVYCLWGLLISVPRRYAVNSVIRDMLWYTHRHRSFCTLYRFQPFPIFLWEEFNKENCINGCLYIHIYIP
jgi:hypothetical protein